MIPYIARLKFKSYTIDCSMWAKDKLGAKNYIKKHYPMAEVLELKEDR